MITIKSTYNVLISLTLISFAIFGSLSHLFSLGLILLVLFTRVSTAKKFKYDLKSLMLFISLTGCFFVFLLSCIFKSNLGSSIQSISPMLSIPLIGLLIIFQKDVPFKLNSQQISKFSQIAIFCALFIYVLLSVFSGPHSIFYKFYSGRVELFSGNPIPFSYVMLGVSIFCLADWWKSNTIRKIIAFSCFLVGIWFSGFLSGTRGTLLSVMIISPVILFYLCKNIKITVFTFLFAAAFGILLVKLEATIFSDSSYFNRITNGLETLVSPNKIDSSIEQRLQMWSASVQAIAHGPMFGYNVENRFNAINPYLPVSFTSTYSHPHNDILASIISVGFLGGIAAFISLMSGFLASILTSSKSIEKICLSLMIAVPTLITANLSTVFFNDISSAWLAFSAYLIWTLEFQNNEFKLNE